MLFRCYPSVIAPKRTITEETKISEIILALTRAPIILTGTTLKTVFYCRLSNVS